MHAKATFTSGRSGCRGLSRLELGHFIRMITHVITCLCELASVAGQKRLYESVTKSDIARWFGFIIHFDH